MEERIEKLELYVKQLKEEIDDNKKYIELVCGNTVLLVKKVFPKACKECKDFMRMIDKIKD